MCRDAPIDGIQKPQDAVHDEDDVRQAEGQAQPTGCGGKHMHVDEGLVVHLTTSYVATLLREQAQSLQPVVT